MFCVIGTPVGAETPEELVVSIVVEECAEEKSSRDVLRNQCVVAYQPIRK